MNICEFWGLHKPSESNAASAYPNPPEFGDPDYGKAEVTEALRLLREATGNPELAKQRISEMTLLLGDCVVFRAVPLFYLPYDRDSATRGFVEVAGWGDHLKDLWEMGMCLVYSLNDKPIDQPLLARVCALALLDFIGTLNRQIMDFNQFACLQKDFADRYGLTEFGNDPTVYLKLVTSLHPDVARSWEGIKRAIENQR